jgi:hypothetical protein
MDGLRYVMEYRIKGGRFPSLDYDIMKRLADGLLMNMGDSEKKGRFNQSQVLSEEADVAFQLFGEFLLEGNKKSSTKRSQLDSYSPRDRLDSNVALFLSHLPPLKQCKSFVKRLVRSLYRICVMPSSWMSAVVQDRPYRNNSPR